MTFPEETARAAGASADPGAPAAGRRCPHRLCGLPPARPDHPRRTAAGRRIPGRLHRPAQAGRSGRGRAPFHRPGRGQPQRHRPRPCSYWQGRAWPPAARRRRPGPLRRGGGAAAGLLRPTGRAGKRRCGERPGRGAPPASPLEPRPGNPPPSPRGTGTGGAGAGPRWRDPGGPGNSCGWKNWRQDAAEKALVAAGRPDHAGPPGLPGRCCWPMAGPPPTRAAGPRRWSRRCSMPPAGEQFRPGGCSSSNPAGLMETLPERHPSVPRHRDRPCARPC